MTDQEEKDRAEREKTLASRRRAETGKGSSAHHSRMYRYHDGMARVLSKALKKSGNKELKRQHDFHVSRCSHHEKHLGEAKVPTSGGASRFKALEKVGQSYQPKPKVSTSGKTKAKTGFTVANRDDDSDD